LDFLSFLTGFLLPLLCFDFFSILSYFFVSRWDYQYLLNMI